MNKQVVDKMQHLGLQYEDTFKQERQLIDEMVKKESELTLDLKAEKEAFKAVYENIKTAAMAYGFSVTTFMVGVSFGLYCWYAWHIAKAEYELLRELNFL